MIDQSGGVLLQQLERLARDWDSLNARTRHFHWTRLRLLWASVNNADLGCCPDETEERDGNSRHG